MEHGGAFGDQLKAVLVAGDQQAGVSRLSAQTAHGPQQIVCLIARQLHPQDAHGVQHRFQHRQLQGQLLRYGLALGLIAVVGLVAEGWFPPVKGHAEPIGLFLLQQLLQNGHKAIDRVGGRPVGGVQRPHAVKGPVDQAVAVQNHQFHPAILPGDVFSLL